MNVRNSIGAQVATLAALIGAFSVGSSLVSETCVPSAHCSRAHLQTQMDDCWIGS